MKKVLLIFDLNKTLLLAFQSGKQKFFNAYDNLDTIPHSDKYKNYKIYYRPSRAEFLDYIFMKNQDFFEVGVWSSLDRDKTGALTKSFFGRHYRNLLFVSATRREEYEGIKTDYDINPIAIKRDLGQLFQKFKDFDMNNTIVISTNSNQMEIYKQNDIIVPIYDPTILGPNFEIDMALQGLTKYFRGMRFFVTKRKVSDVRPILSSKSFTFLLERITNTSLNYNEFN